VSFLARCPVVMHPREYLVQNQMLAIAEYTEPDPSPQAVRVLLDALRFFLVPRLYTLRDINLP
jgi:hypothetical protein